MEMILQKMFWNLFNKEVNTKRELCICIHQVLKIIKKLRCLFAPGGGYGRLSCRKKGAEIARWFNSIGVTAFRVYYRMPFGHHQVPLEGYKKTAMEIIRNNAKQWKLNKNRIGVIGFSAGGHLAATLGTHF